MSDLKKYIRNINDEEEWGYKIILFLIFPFFAFITSLLNPNSRSSYFIYFVFGLLFCWHMDVMDVARYDDLQGIMDYIRNNPISTEEMGKQIGLYFSFSEGAPKELYMNILIWFSGLFSPNPHLVFTVAAIPWLFFFLKSLKEITSDSKFQAGSWLCLGILLLFVFPRDILTLQNPRFTTGVWMIIYACIRLFGTGRNRLRYIWLILITPIIHSGFIPFALLTPIALIMARHFKASMILFIISIPFSSFVYDLIIGVDFTKLFLPDSISRWIIGSLSEASYSKFVLREGGSGFYWVGSIFRYLMQIAYLTIPVLLWRERKSLIEINSNTRRFTTFYIFLFAVVNFIQFIPILGERYYWFIRIFSVLIFFKVLYPKYKWWVWVCLFACSFYIFTRYFYHGAVSSSVPLEIFYAPTPYLIWDFLGI